MASISLRNLVKLYDRQPVIHGVDLDIGDGELVVLVGPSGCGKSTLLRMIAGLEEISDGELRIGERRANELPPAQRGLAMVFQSYALYPHMSVFENMAFALKLAGGKAAEVNAAVQRAAAILQIGHLLERKPKDLSGGQRQRVAIGRAIVRKPQVFLFDEPLSNLDASLRVQMRVEISRLHKELKTTMVYVTHDQVEAMTLGERIVVINAGRIEQVGTPFELYDNPGKLFVAGFLGTPKMNLMAGQVAASSAAMVQVRLAGGALLEVAADGRAARPGEAVTLGARAEHITVNATGGQAANLLEAEVGHIEYLGDQSIVYARLDGVTQLIAVKQPIELARPVAGSRIALHLPAGRCHLFDAAGLAFPRTTAESV
jgi:multiple sugar transport system ATP-binding protein